MTPRLPRRRARAGFTLVEVLVALLMMALLTALAWQALDGVFRAREDAQRSVDRSSRLATVLMQWEQDLQAVVDTESVPPLAFDGQTLRLTRRTDAGVAVVAWSLREGRWLRWTAPALVRSGDLQEAWMRCLMLQGSEPGHVELLQGAQEWQIYYARGGSWSNAQSTGDLAPATAAAAATAAAPPTPTPASGAGAGTEPPPPVESTRTAADAPAAGASAPPPAPAASAPSAAPRLREALPEGVRLVIRLDGQKLTRDIALGPAGS